MSLQEASSLPPNKILDERAEGNSGSVYRSVQRLSQLTQRAVDKALKLQAESGRLVDIVDTQSCGEQAEFGCLFKYPFSPSASKILKNTTFLIQSSSSQKRAPSKESRDRRTVAGKIYSALIQWRSDVSFEWRSRVVLAVPVLEEALYRVAKSKEEYASLQLLEHVLLHFEAGNGLFLLQGTKPLYPVQASHTTLMTGQGTAEHIDCLTGDLCQSTHDDALPGENADTIHAVNDLSSGLDSESCLTDNCFLWDGLEMELPAPMKVSVHNKHRDNPGKRITNRVASMLSKRRSDNHARLRHELTRALHSEENIPSAGVRVDDARTEMLNDGELFEPSQIKQESPCHGEIRTRKSSRKTLGDLIDWNLTKLLAIGNALSINVNEDHAVSFMNNDSNCLEPSEMAHSFCTPEVDSMRIEASNPLPSSSYLASNESSSIELTHSSLQDHPLCKDETKLSTGSLSLGLPTASISSASHMAPLQSRQSLPKLKESTPWPACSSSTSEALPAPFPSSPSPLSATVLSIESTAISHVSTSSTMVSLASSLSQVSSHASSSSSSSPSSLSASHVSSSSSSNTAQISESDQLGLASSLPPTGLSMQSLPCTPPSLASIEGEQSQEQLAATAVVSQDIEREAAARLVLPTASTATTSNDSLSEARGRGARLPLSIFLLERDELDVSSMAEVSGDSAHSWSTWEEPTEQIDPLCCVCMVGLKGAAFIPCGHTFCRRCSRELRKGRGSCPLCNRYIREILDVY